MIKEKELAQVRSYVIEVLPELLLQEPTLVATLEGLIAHQFPRRDEFAQLLEQVNFMHKDMDRRFELQREELNSLREELSLVREQLTLQNPQQSVSGGFISVGAGERVKQRCASLGLEFVG